MLLPPRVSTVEPDSGQRRSWGLDALDALTEARGRRLAERGDSRFGELYVVVVGIVVVTAMTASLASGVLSRSCTGPICAGGTANVAFGWLAGALALALTGAVALGARAVGPAGLSAARRSWFGTAPVDRALSLRSPLTTVIVAGVAVGLVGGVMVALTGSGGTPELAMLVAGAGAGGALAALVVVLAAHAQASGVERAWRVAGWTVLVLGVVAAALAVGPVPLPLMPDVPVAPVVALVALLIVTLAAAIIGWVLLQRRLRAVTLVELQRAGDTSEAAVASLVMLEATALEELRGARSLARRGTYRSRPVRGHGVFAVVGAELRRLRRARTPLPAALLLAPLPVLLGALLGPLAATVVAALMGVFIGNGVAGGLRMWTRSTSVNRLFPIPAPLLRAGYLVVPTLVAGGWLAVVCAAAGLGWATWAVLATAVPAAVLRSAPKSEMGLAAGNIAMTPMGAVPVGVLMVLVRGPDVMAIPVLLLLVGFPGAGFMLALAMVLGLLVRD